MASLYLVLTNVLGGACYPAIAVALKSLPARDVAFWRMGLSCIFLLPFLWTGRRRLLNVSLRDWGLMSVVGFLGYSLPLALGICGQRLSSASSASVLLAMEPVTIAALSCLLLGERLTLTKVLALVAGFSGTMLITFQGLPSLGQALSGRAAGNLMLAAAGICWSLYTVAGKPVLSRVSVLDYTAATTWLAFLGVAAWAGPSLSVSAWRSAGAGPWLAVLFMAVAGNLLSAWFWNLAAAEVEATKVANFIFLQPLVGVALGTWWLGEPLTLWTLAGGALILAGVRAATRPS